jgi:hypothetical protein
MLDKELNIGELMKELKNNPVVKATLPLDYCAGIPLLHINTATDEIYLVVPYYRFTAVRGQKDESRVYAPKIVFTLSLPGGRVVKFEDLSHSEAFSKVKYDVPVAKFRHEEILNMNRQQYNDAKDEIYSGMTKMINAICGVGEFTADEEAQFKSLYAKLVGASLIPFYKVIEKTFSEKYLTN